MPRLAVKKTNRLTQAVVYFRRHFLCGALSCDCLSAKREGLYNGNAQQNPLCAASCVTKDIPVSPRFSPTFFYPDASSVLLRAHLCSAVDSKPCVRNCPREREGLYNGNVQQNPLCAASCVTKDILVSTRFSPTFFYPDANSVQYVSTPLNPVFEIVQGSVEVCTTGMSSRTLYAQHPVSLRIFPSLPGSRLRFLSPGKFLTLQ